MRIPEIGNKSWVARANCRSTNPTVFFKITGPGAGKKNQLRAKEVCRACPVARDCLETHMLEAAGIFGGMTPRERLGFLLERKYESWNCAEYYSKLREALLHILKTRESELSSAELLERLQRLNSAYWTYRPMHMMPGAFLCLMQPGVITTGPIG